MGMPKGQTIDPLSLKERRLTAKSLLSNGLPQAEVARHMGVSRQSVSRWARATPQVLAEVKSQGRKTRLSPEAYEELRNTLSQEAPDQAAWTIIKMRTLLARITRIQYSATQAWRILRKLKSMQ